MGKIILIIAKKLQKSGARLIVKVDPQEIPDVLLHGISAVGSLECAELGKLSSVERLLKLVGAHHELGFRDDLADVNDTGNRLLLGMSSRGILKCHQLAAKLTKKQSIQ